MRSFAKKSLLYVFCLACSLPYMSEVACKSSDTKKISSKKKDPLKRKKSERGPSKAINDMNLAELRTEKNRLLGKADHESALRYIEKMIPLCTDPKELQEITLELADVLFKVQEYEKAQTMYADFVKFYPGSARLEEASFHAIESCCKQMLETDRDQTKTKETIELAQTFLARPLFTQYRPQVIKIAHDCNKRLWDHEEYIITHYLQRGKVRGAQKHIELLEKSLLPVLPDCELRLLAVQASYADATHQPQQAQEKRALIQAKLSQDPSLKQTPLVLAQASTGKENKPFTRRF